MGIIKSIKEKLNARKKEEASPEYKAFLSADLSKYKKGEYVLFTDKGVYSHGFDLVKLKKSFKKEFPDKVPAVFKIPPSNFILEAS